MTKHSYPWLKPGIWGAVIGVIGITALGFSQFGWMLSSKAELMAQDRASVAVAKAMGPVCAAKFMAQTDAPAQLAALKKLSSEYEQRNLIEKGGWAGTSADTTNYQLIAECTKTLIVGKIA